MNIAEFMRKQAAKGKKVSTRAKGEDDTGIVYTVSADAMLAGDTLAAVSNEAARAGVKTKVGFKRDVEGVTLAHGVTADSDDAREVWAGLRPITVETPADQPVNPPARRTRPANATA